MPSRTFVNADGTPWNAWDVVPGEHDWPENARRHLPGSMADGWLCFESAGAGKRRIHPIPPGWERWTEDELRSRWATAQPVLPRPG